MYSGRVAYVYASQPFWSKDQAHFPICVVFVAVIEVPFTYLRVAEIWQKEPPADRRKTAERAREHVVDIFTYDISIGC